MVGPEVVDWKRHEVGMPVGSDGVDDGVLAMERMWRAALRLTMSEAMVLVLGCECFFLFFFKIKWWIGGGVG